MQWGHSKATNVWVCDSRQQLGHGLEVIIHGGRKQWSAMLIIDDIDECT